MILPNSFVLIGAHTIREWLRSNSALVLQLTTDAYIAYARGLMVNPTSCFLRFPGNNIDRIIALPASLEDDSPICGVKWVSSFPRNTAHGRARASGVIILNDRVTGIPIACLEGSAISTARTAASALIGAINLHPMAPNIARLGVVGCGVISRAIIEMFIESGWSIGEIALSDLSSERAYDMMRGIQELHEGVACVSVENAILQSDMILFATTAVEPFIYQADWFSHNPTVLHISLRDLGVPIIQSAQNIVDSIDLCLKADTSLHLTEKHVGNRNFIAGEIKDMLAGSLLPDVTRPRIWSPFGMGILDLTVAREIFIKAPRDACMVFDGFLG